MQDNPETAGSSDVTSTTRRHKKTSLDEALLMGAKLADFALDLSHCFLRLHDPKLERPDLTARQCRGARTRDANRIHARSWNYRYDAHGADCTSRKEHNLDTFCLFIDSQKALTPCHEPRSSRHSDDSDCQLIS